MQGTHGRTEPASPVFAHAMSAAAHGEQPLPEVYLLQMQALAEWAAGLQHTLAHMNGNTQRRNDYDPAPAAPPHAYAAGRSAVGPIEHRPRPDWSLPPPPPGDCAVAPVPHRSKAKGNGIGNLRTCVPLPIQSVAPLFCCEPL